MIFTKTPINVTTLKTRLGGKMRHVGIEVSFIKTKTTESANELRIPGCLICRLPNNTLFGVTVT